MKDIDLAHLVHGMQGECVEASWPPIVASDIKLLLESQAMWNQFHTDSDFKKSFDDEVVILWTSPRPMSGAVIALLGEKKVFVKRHHISVRSMEDMHLEHGFIKHLSANGIRVPYFYANAGQETVFLQGQFIYELSEVLSGVDLYQDRPSWSSYLSLQQAYNAGQALARLHDVAENFKAPERKFNVLQNSSTVIMADDPLAKLEVLLSSVPAVSHGIIEQAGSLKSFLKAFTNTHLWYIEKLATYKNSISLHYIHGDWHPSNMTWTSVAEDAAVENIFDFGLSNLSFFQHDIAIAIERAFVDWLDLKGLGAITCDLEGVGIFLSGYDSLRKLSLWDLELIADLMPICHFEYALSEVGYFSSVLKQPDNAALAYDSYLFDHSEFFRTKAGVELSCYIRKFTPSTANLKG